MGRTEFAVLIPAHNEESTIGKLVDALSKSADVVVVDDGSTDRTSKIATSSGAHVVSLPKNMGYDSALASGIAYVRDRGYKGFVTCDADGQHLPSDVLSALALLIDNPLVVGARGKLTRVSERVFAQAARASFGIRDPLCGLKAYHLEFVPDDFSQHLSRSSGVGLALKMVTLGVEAINMPISIQDRSSGAPRFGGTFRANSRIFLSLLRAFPLKAQMCLGRAKH